MANATKYGFWPVLDNSNKAPRKYPLTASQTIAVGDVVILDSAGRVSVGAATSAKGVYLGVAASSSGGSNSAGDPISVWDDPNMIFEAMVSTGALADCYTTRSYAACFDLIGTTGAMYVNSAGSTYDVFKVIGEAAKDPVTGINSAVGSNQMKHVQFTRGSHAYGDLA